MAARRLSRARRIQIGLAAARRPIHDQDLIWARRSGDKPDIGRSLLAAIRGLPAAERLRALSVGSSSEPQFRILTAACAGGLWLLDLDRRALAAAADRAARQHVDGVHPVVTDLTRALADRSAARTLRRNHLGGRRMHLVTFHHSLYYAPRPTWDAIVDATYRELLVAAGPTGPRSVLHAVLMANRTRDPHSTTGIYGRFAGQFFGARNTQDLAGFGRDLARTGTLPGAEVDVATTRVVFDADDFGDFMAVIWMILLHPNVHRFDETQQEEVTEWVYRELWSVGRPLVQVQDHLTIRRGQPG